MTLANTALMYGSVTKTFHWLTALLIVTLIPLGIFANDLPYDTSGELARKAWYFSLHKTLGVFVFFVALARIFWALTQPKPVPLHPERRAETFLAATVHWLLYGSLLLVPLSGWIHHASTSGFAPIWWPFGQNLPLVPKSESLAATTAGLHIVFERVLAVSIFLHFAGALKHHFIDKDVTLLRMLPGKPTVPQTESAEGIVLPLVSALVIWSASLAGGSVLGIYQSHDSSVQAAALEAVESDWIVEEGALDITVTQLGSPVTGTFAEWTAAIRFDETVESGPAGSVEVVVSIGSLTLGSVTSQAMGPDFFNVDAFPTATFAAEIERGPDGYTATGTLTVKDQTMPLTLPFNLETEDGLATMSGSTAVNRMDYNVGTSQSDESSLGFTVDISVQLTAREGDGSGA
ncbi:MAG: cytochrome b/b6 domain-containing protein [Pseudomonadota bacterium]